MVATRCGLAVSSTFWDSWAFQFWGSEQVSKGIPLTSPRSYFVDPTKSAFSRRQIRQFEAQARKLNEAHQGDQAGFILVRRQEAWALADTGRDA
jgi:hypothetical protein